MPKFVTKIEEPERPKLVTLRQLSTGVLVEVAGIGVLHITDGGRVARVYAAQSARVSTQLNFDPEGYVIIT